MKDERVSIPTCNVDNETRTRGGKSACSALTVSAQCLHSRAWNPAAVQPQLQCRPQAHRQTWLHVQKDSAVYAENQLRRSLAPQSKHPILRRTAEAKPTGWSEHVPRMELEAERSALKVLQDDGEIATTAGKR
jgi:hypothetical protein